MNAYSVIGKYIHMEVKYQKPVAPCFDNCHMHDHYFNLYSICMYIIHAPEVFTSSLIVSLIPFA